MFPEILVTHVHFDFFFLFRLNQLYTLFCDILCLVYVYIKFVFVLLP